MKKILLSSALACCTLSLFAQKTLSGRVIEPATHEPLGYVSIGIPGTSIGTVAGEDGRFVLEIPDKTSLTARDSVQFSMLGFRKKSVPLSAWTDPVKPLEITLDPAALQLREVVVRSKETRLKTLGKEKSKYRMVVNFALEGKVNQNLGSEIGRRFKVSKASSLEKFRFYVVANDFDTVRFRINVYDLRKGKPGESLLQEQIVITLTGKQTGWVTVDLQPYEIIADQTLAVGVEWIYGSKGGTVLTLPIAMPVVGSKHYYKYGSRNRWKSFAGMSAAMLLDVRS
jgi:hypothetical protein